MGHLTIQSFLPVAQLDRATDSDSVGRRFESCRVGQTQGDTTWCPLVFCLPDWYREAVCDACIAAQQTLLAMFVRVPLAARSWVLNPGG